MTTLQGELILPEDVEIRPLRDLPAELRAALDDEDGEYAITRRRSRSGSRIIDAESAELLAHFRAPTRIVDAVLAFAVLRRVDPEQILEQAWPLLSRLRDANFLVPADSAEAQVIEARLRPGDVFEGFRLLRSLQLLDDNEVFLARDDAGRFAALKFFRHPDERVRGSVANEVGALERMSGKVAPELLSVVDGGDGLMVLTEWIFGTDVVKACATIRSDLVKNGEVALLTLCADVADGFADLHQRGVLHGDVHPRNVLIDGRRGVRIIDFGLSRIVDASAGAPPRGGVPFYFDPQFAEAQLAFETSPLTEAAEQYSIAALLYLLLTGVHYLDFRVGRDELLRQIVEQEPITFASRSVPPWPALEDVLRRALEKRPERRFESTRHFAHALRALLPEAGARDGRAAPRQRRRAHDDELLEGALRRYALGGHALRDGPRDAPLSSINYGAGGIAYATYRLAQRRRDPGLLALADVWTQKAFALSSGERAFFNAAFGIERETVGDVSLFHSMSGLHCLRALVSVAQGDARTASAAIDAFVAAARAPTDRFDLTLGRGGLLLGCSEIVEAIPVAWVVDTASTRACGDEMAATLTDLLRSHTIASSSVFRMLGIAHGWAGILFALLRWAKATGTPCDPIVGERLGELASLAEPHDAGMRWPVYAASDSPSFTDGWCSGTAGYVMLFALAHDVLGSPSAGDLAERAAACAWSSGMRLGTLCCGLGGVAYALAAAHRLTGSPVWLDRARVMCRRAAADSSAHFLRDALYKGAVGVAVLADGLAEDGTTAMPLFEPTPLAV